MEYIATASFVLLGATAAVYLLLAYLPHRRLFFLLMGMAWLWNAFYIACEACETWAQRLFLYGEQSTNAVASASDDQRLLTAIFTYTMSLPTSYLLYLSYISLEDKSVRSVLYGLLSVRIITWTSFICLAIVLSIYLTMLPGDYRFRVLITPGILFSFWSMFRLAAKINSLSDVQMLELVRNPMYFGPRLENDKKTLDYAATEFSQQVSDRVRNPLWVSRKLLFLSLGIYGFLQFCYFLKYGGSHPRLMLTAFGVGFVLKALNLIAISCLIVADYEHFAEQLRAKSLAEVLGALTASIEHDIRNPLRNLRKEVESIQCLYSNDARLRKKLEFILSQSLRIRAAVSVILMIRAPEDFIRQSSTPCNLVERGARIRESG